MPAIWSSRPASSIRTSTSTSPAEPSGKDSTRRRARPPPAASRRSSTCRSTACRRRRRRGARSEAARGARPVSCGCRILGRRCRNVPATERPHARAARRRRRARVQVLPRAVRRRRIPARRRAAPAAGDADARAAEMCRCWCTRNCRIASAPHAGRACQLSRLRGDASGGRRSRRDSTDGAPGSETRRARPHRPRVVGRRRRRDRRSPGCRHADHGGDLSALPDVCRRRDSRRRDGIQVRAADSRRATIARRSGAACASGTLSLVASDHSPAPPAMKCPGDFVRAWGGIASLELALAAVWTERVRADSRRGHRAVDERGAGRARRSVRTQGPDRAGLRCRSRRVGSGRRSSPSTPSQLQQRHKMTPYAGRRLRGAVRTTFVRGQRVWDRGGLVQPALGELL